MWARLMLPHHLHDLETRDVKMRRTFAKEKRLEINRGK